MSPAHVLEPTYARLKRGLMEGKWPAGSKLEALRLADDFGVSMTPVRDCLNRLVGERLVEMQPGEGYRVSRLSEQDIREMLAMTGVLLDHVLAVEANILPVPEAYERPDGDYAERVAHLFAYLAGLSGNAVLRQTVISFGERLHSLRVAEPHLISGAEEELASLERLVSGNASEISSAISAFLDRRLANVAMLARSVE